MQKSVRQVLALTLVATALCADRAVVASAAIRPDADARPAARTLVGRLTVSLRRTVPAVRLLEIRRDNDRSPVVADMSVESLKFQPQPTGPFQFRLPPPQVPFR